jgi:simple sugar transport system permease protein
LTFPVALLFGAAEALSLRLQSAGTTVSQHLLHMLPYVVSLVVFVATCLRRGTSGGAPAGLRAVLER